MNKDVKIKKAIEGISDKYIEEAYTFKTKFEIRRVSMRVAIVTVAAAMMILVYNLLLQDIPYIEESALKIYAGETEILLMDEYSIISTGKVTDNSSVSGMPLSFFIESDDIEKVRYSCKNELISFYAPQQEYDNSKNFTVEYGRYGDNINNEYDFYTCKRLSWNPEKMLAKITEKGSIEALSEEERTDIIVMEVSYKDGSSECIAIRIQLDDSGAFCGRIQSYIITEEDEFVYGQDAMSYQDMLEQKEETAKECEELVINSMKEFSAEQTKNIFDSARGYYSKMYYTITDMVLVDKSVAVYAENSDYTEEELVYIHVWGPEIDENTWRHIIIGSKDDWNTCEVVGEGY